MARFSASGIVDAPDVSVLVRLAAAVLERWRSVDVDADGIVHPTTGERRQGMRVERGTHPRVGTVYRVFTEPLDDHATTSDSSDTPGTSDTPDTASTDAAVGPASPTGRADGPGPGDDGWRSFTAEVRRDDREALDVLVNTTAGAEGTVAVVVSTPGAPSRLTADVDLRVPGRWPLRGPVRADVVAELPAGSGRRTPSDAVGRVAVTGRHPRVRGRATVEATAVDRDRWRVDVDVRLRGRGLLRPFVAVLLRSARRTVQDDLDRVLASGWWATLAADTRAAADDLDGHADLILIDSIEQVPRRVPDGVFGRS